MRKRALSIVLTFAMCLSTMSVTAWAEELDEGGSAEAEVEEVIVEQVYVPDPDLLPDSDELFAGYVEQTMYADFNYGIALVGISAGEMLADANYTIYSILKGEIADVAAGTTASTVFTIDTANMGITYADETLSGIDTDSIISALMVDCPYELYWYNKTVGVTTSWSYYTSGDVSSMTFKFTVASDYAGSEAYTTDQSKTSATDTAVETAKDVVAANASKSDYEKLVAYREYICGAVTYNNDAAGGGVSYGDPWQLIYVFDDNADTNVVCEGYAKAFQYLCDLTEFEDENIRCYTVSGKMTGGTGAGSHMWNIVTMDDGYNYLVDVTNCDGFSLTVSGNSYSWSCSPGFPDRLFLAGASGSVSSGYTVTTEAVQYTDPETNTTVTLSASQIDYEYYDGTTSGTTNQVALWGEGILTLSASNYLYQQSLTVTAPTTAAATYGQTLNDVSLTGGTAVDSSGNAVAGTWAWADDTQSVGSVGAKTFQAVFTPVDTGSYQTVENISVTVTVSAKTLTDVTIDTIADQTYTGSEITPSVTVTATGLVSGDTLTAGTDYEVSYDNNINVGTATVTVTAKADSNYTWTGSVTGTFAIVQGTRTVTITGNLSKTYDGGAVDTSELTVSPSGNVTYAFYSDENCTTSISAPTDAGTYWVQATLAADGNYEAAVSNALEFTISPADYTYTYSEDTSVTVGAAYPTGDTASAAGVGTETVSGTLAWFTNAACTDEATGSFETVGSTVLYWKFTPDANQSNYVSTSQSDSVVYTVNALPAQSLTFAESTKEVTYGTGSFTVTASNSSTGGGAVTYISSDTSVATVDATTGTVTIVGAGETTITATAAEVPGTYAETTASYTLTVSPKTLTVADLEYSGSTTKAYDGTTDSEITVKVKASSLVGSDSLTVTGTAVYDNKSVGTAHTITFTPDAITDGNYRLAASEVLTISGASITAKEITITVEDIENQTYTGDAINPVVTVTSNDLVSGDTLTLNADYTVAYSNNTAVGTATVNVSSVSGSNYTFSATAVNFNITHEITSITVNGLTAPVKNGTPVTNVTLEETGITAGTVTWYEGETDSTTLSGNFAASTVYRVEISYTLESGYSVADDASVTATGSTSAIIDVTGSKIVIVYPATDDKDTLGGSVTIDGDSTFGQTLTANTDGLDYGTEGEGTLSYQWYRGGFAIDGATGNTYTLAEADVGEIITVTVTNSNNSGSVTSTDTAAVDKAACTTAATVAEVSATTDTSVTVTVVSGQEYAITTGNTEPTTGWQESGSFSGLSPNTSYTIYTRVKETTTTKASASVTTSVTTAKQTQIITVTNSSPSVVFGGTLDLSDLCSSDAPNANLVYTQSGTLPDGTTLNGSIVNAGNTEGTFTVTVSSGEVGDYAAATNVTLTITITAKSDAGVTLSATSATVTYGDTVTLTASVTNAGTGTGTWIWESSDTSVLTVTGNTATPTVTILKAGSATITATYESDTTLGSATQTVTVQPKSITITGVQATNRDYEPGNISVDLTGGELSGIVSDDDVSFTLNDGTLTNADAGTDKSVTTNITLAGSDAGNYTLTQPTDITVTINKANPDCTAPSNITAVFGTTLASAAIGTPGAGAGSWAWKDGSQTVGDVGSNNHDMVFTPTDSTNYNSVTVSVSVEVSKASAPSLNAVSVTQKYTYASGTATISGMPTDAGTVTYTAGTALTSGSIAVSTWSVDADGVVSYTLSGGEAGNTVTLPVTVSSTNYENAAVNVVITLTALDTQNDFKFESASQSATYGDSGITYTASGAATGSTVTYSSSNTGVATVDNTGAVTIVGAGSTTITAAASATSDYAAATASYTLTVGKATLTPSIAGTTTKTYDGTTNAASDLSITLTGAVNGDTPTAAATSYAYNSKNVNEATTITATGIALDSTWQANYALSSSTATVNGTITQKPVTATVTAENKTYDGATDATVIATVASTELYGTDSITISGLTGAFDDANAGTNKTVNINASNVSATGAENYSITYPATATASITKAAAQALAGQAVSVKYNAAGAQTVSLAGLMPTDAGTLTYTAGDKTDSNGIIASWSAADGALTYTLTSGLTADDAGKTAALPVTIQSTNYEDSTVRVVVTLTDLQTQASLTITSATSVTYGETLTLSTSGGSGSGAVTYTVTNGTGTADISGSVLTATQAGTVTVTATKASDDTYLAATATAVITINPASIADAVVTLNPAVAAGSVDNSKDRTTNVKSVELNGVTLIEGTDYTVTIPEGMAAAGDYTVTVTGTGNYTGAATATFTINPVAEIILTDTDDDGNQLKLEVETGISTVPSGLTTTDYNTVEKIETELKTVLTESNAAISEEDTAVYEVTLMVSNDGGTTWETATAKNFPTAGLTVTLPYPDDTDSSYTFTVVHMFTTTDFGKTPGETETPKVTNTADGIRFTVTGLSPISVGWVAPTSSNGGSSSSSGSTVTRTVTVGDTDNGSVSSSKTRAASGTTVTLTVTPDEGYELDELTVTNVSTGKAIKLTQISDTQYTFTMPAAKVTIEATFVEIEEDEPVEPAESVELPFLDVAENSWYYSAVQYAYENGLMTGTSATTFEPDSLTSRAMLVTILYRLEGEPSVTGVSNFADVVDGAWYADAVSWASQNGIVNGYDNGCFGPSDIITREQMAAILYRYAQYKGYDVSVGENTNILSYTDALEISEWAMESMQWAVGAGLITGTTTSTLAPHDYSSRAVMATILMRFCENVMQ